MSGDCKDCRNWSEDPMDEGCVRWKVEPTEECFEPRPVWTEEMIADINKRAAELYRKFDSEGKL